MGAVAAYLYSRDVTQYLLLKLKRLHVTTLTFGNLVK